MKRENKNKKAIATKVYEEVMAKYPSLMEKLKNS